MPGTTPLFAFPYPLGTDPISDGDDQMKALAERVEAILKPTVVMPVLTAQVGAPAAGWAPFTVYKYGKTCTLVGAQNFVASAGTAMAAATLIASMPASVLPVARVGGGAFYGGIGPAVFLLDVNGGLTTYGPAFPINTTISVNATWTTAG